FSNLTLALGAGEQIALVGNNGMGKSTLLRILTGEFLPAAGRVSLGGRPYYVPQLFGQYNQMTVAEALGIAVKLKALYGILEGDVTEQYYEQLEDDWAIEERSRQALADWDLG